MKKTEPLTQQQRYEFYATRKNRVMVDFDGTLCQWAYPDIGEPEPGAKEFMTTLIEYGFEPVVYTCRVSPEFNTEEERAEQIRKIAEWLQRHDIPYHSIDTGESGKPLALLYVDDRGAQYAGDWDAVMRRLNKVAEREAQILEERGFHG